MENKTTSNVPAAACPKCGGWTSFGGMSQYRDHSFPIHGRTGCRCNRLPITGDGWALVDEGHGGPVCQNDVRLDFRGDALRVVSGRPPHKSSSQGHVHVRPHDLNQDDGYPTEYYASVVGAKWVKIRPVQRPPLPAAQKARRVDPRELPTFYSAKLSGTYAKDCGIPGLPDDGSVRVLDIEGDWAYLEHGNTLWTVPAKYLRC